MSAKILLVEDDKSLGYMLSEYLKFKGFSVSWEQDFNSAIEKFSSEQFDLCILDVVLPSGDGFKLSDEIRRIAPGVPFIFLTARSMKVDILRGFKHGADDYLTKPVDEEELVARLTAILKRAEIKNEAKPTVITFGDFSFYPSTQEISSSGKAISLTKKESQLIELLCENIGELVSTETILHKLWGKSDFFNRRSMDVFISRIRKKLSHDPSVSIVNIHGKGFVLKVNSDS